MSAWPALKFKLRRSNAFHASRQVSENSELFKKIEPGDQFQGRRISSTIQPRCSLRGSKVEPTTSSQYSSFRGRERSLDPRRLRRAVRHSRTTVLRPSAYVDLQPLDLTGGEEMSNSLFVSTLRPPPRIGPSMQVFHQVSGSPDQAYPNPHCAYVGCRPFYGPSAFRLPRAIWRGIAEAPVNIP